MAIESGMLFLFAHAGEKLIVHTRNQACRSQQGFSFVEVATVLALMSILGAIAVLGLRSDFLEFSTTASRILTTLRQARADAITRGAHYRVSLVSDDLKTQRLQDDDGDGEWELEEETACLNVPDGVTVTMAGNLLSATEESLVEFTTRGTLVPADDSVVASTVTLTITDTASGAQRVLEIWPSGQIGWQTVQSQ